MVLGLYLLRPTRTALLTKAIEGGYINPHGSKAVGLSSFLDDLAQRSFHVNPDIVYPVTIQGPGFHPIEFNNIADVPRPKQPTVPWSSPVSTSVQRYTTLAHTFNLTDRTVYFTVSNFLNAVGLDLLSPGAWPQRLQGWENKLDVPKSLKGANLKPIDITDALSYSLTREAFNHLIDLGTQDGFIKAMRGKAWRAYGLSEYLTALSFSEFQDWRSPEQKELNHRLKWGNGVDYKESHLLRLSLETRGRYIAQAHTFEIYPMSRYTETSITSAVLEAIGLALLVPITRPSRTLQHGPTLQNEPVQ